MTKYFIYHLRWQLSAWIMMPFLYWFKNYPLWISFCVTQFIGALIFWYIDKKIFK